jgi:hypothetical protein
MFEQLQKKKKLERAKKMFIDALNKDTKWQQEARDDFKFRDGDQWSDEEKQILEEELRPVLTFNLTKSSIDLIMGMNEDNRIVHRASPTEPTDAFLCEVLNDLSEYVGQTQDFEEEEDGALESAAICGRGWVGIDFVPDPERFGNIKMTEVNVPVHEAHYDPSARKGTMKDASYLVWDRWMTKEDFKIRFPQVGPKKMEEFIESATIYGNTGDPISDDGIPISDHESVDYERPMDVDINFFDRQENMIRVVHMEYWEYYKRYYAFNPEVGDWIELEEAPSQEMKDEFLAQFEEEMTVETMYDKRVKWLQFIGDQILFDDVSPLPFAGFSLVPTFAYRDVSQRTQNHFGLVRLMKDPQREVNKRWSQALNMLNQQVQPGVYAETDAFVDERQALQSMKVAGDITWVNAGALTGGKLKERTVPTFPNAPMQMEQFSQDIMKKITGINPDLLGQDRGRQEPGVVVRLRQQQGMTLLKPLFRNFNFMKKELFKRQLAIIMTYMPDSQIQKILGQNDRYDIDEQGIITDVMSQKQDEETGETYFTRQANIRDFRSLEYNVVAEQSPGNQSTRMTELQVLMEMSEKLPVPPEQMISKMEISASEKEQWIEYINMQQEQQMQDQEEQKQFGMQLETRKLDQVDKQREADFLTDMTKYKQMAEKDEKSMAQKYAQMTLDQQTEAKQFALEVLQADQQMLLDAKKAKQDLEIDAVGAAQDLEQDGVKAVQDIGQSGAKSAQQYEAQAERHAQQILQAEQKHRQAMKFIEEKNAIALKAAEDKAAQDLKNAKAQAAIAAKQAKEGGESGKGKPTNDA